MFAVEFVTARPANAPAYYGLCSPGTYNIGRSSDCHITLSAADISRHHATMRVVLRDHMHEVLSTEALQNLAAAFDAENSDGTGEGPFITPIVLIVENHSQFGCRVDNVQLRQEGATAAITSGGGNVHIGGIVLRLTYRPVLVAVNTETFARDFCDELAVMYSKMGAEICAAGPQPSHGQVYHAIDSECRRANATFLPAHRRMLDPQPLPHVVNFGAQPIAKFLVTGAIDASPQCLLGLALGYTLVHASFVFEFFAALAESCIVPMGNAPHPSKYEPPISRLVYPTGGYARPEGRSLPFPLFPPSLATPWYKSRHRVLVNYVITFRNSEVAAALLECTAAMGGRIVPFGDPEQTSAKNPGQQHQQHGSGFLDSGTDDDDDDDDNDNDSVTDPAATNINNNNTSNRTTPPGGVTPQAQSEKGGAMSVANKSRHSSRAWVHSGEAGKIRGSRDSDVDSSTGEPLLLPHQREKRAMLAEKRRLEVQEKIDLQLAQNAMRGDETLDARALGGAGAGGAVGDDPHFNQRQKVTRRKIMLLSPSEVAALAQTAASMLSIPNSVSPSPFDITPEEHELQEDVLAYARNGWDIISCEELLRALLCCETVGPSLLEHLIAPQSPVEAAILMAAAGSGSALAAETAAAAAAAAAAPATKLTEQALQTLQREVSDVSVGATSQKRSVAGGAATAGAGGVFAGVQVGGEQFTEKHNSQDDEAASDRTPSDLDVNDTEDLLRMKPISAGGSLFGNNNNNNHLQSKFEDSLSVALQLDRSKQTVLSRLRRACERNVLTYRTRLTQLRELRLKTNAALDVDKLSVARDALQSCERFLVSLEAAERQLADVDRRNNEQRRKQLQEGNMSQGAAAATLAAINGGGSSPWADAVEPLRDCAVEVAQLAFGIIKKDQPALVAGTDAWYFDGTAGGPPVEGSSSGYESTPAVKGRGGFTGMVQAWEQPKMKPGQRQQQQQQQQHVDTSPKSGVAGAGAATPVTAAAGMALFPEFGSEAQQQQLMMMMTDEDRRILEKQQAKRTAAQQEAADANIHPLTNWVRYSPDIPVAVRGDRKPVIPQGLALAPTHAATRMGHHHHGGGGRNQSAALSSVRGSDLQGIANFRKSLQMQHGEKEGALRFELWIGSQTAQWTQRFHAELERRGLRFSEWLTSGRVVLTGAKEEEDNREHQHGEQQQQQQKRGTPIRSVSEYK